MNNYFVLDIGGSSVKWAILNEKIEEFEGGKVNIPETIEEFFSNICDKVNELKEKYNLKGVAISAPGAVDSYTGVIGGMSAVPYIHGPNFKEIILEKTELRAELENDANCAALGECWLGAGKDTNDSAFVVCGTGIGGAIVKDKRIHRGIHLHGGEFGYCVMSFDYENKKFRSWSELGSTAGMANNVCIAKGLKEYSLSGLEVFQMAEEGDEVAIREIDRYFFNMAIGIYNVQYIYDPEVIILGGAISERPSYVDEINKRMDEIMTIKDDGTVKPYIKASQFGNKANLIGALNHFLQNK